MLVVGATLACGTGACAVVVAAVLEGHAGRVSASIILYRIHFFIYKTCFPVIEFNFEKFLCKQSCTVDLPGGPLDIEWREEDNHVYMTGPAEIVFYGSVPL